MQLDCKKLGKTSVSILEHENCIIFSSGLEPNLAESRRGEQRVGILISKNPVTASKSAGSIVHNDLGARIITVARSRAVYLSLHLLKLEMLIRNFGAIILKNLKYVLVENTLMIFLLLVAILTLVLEHLTNALTAVLRDRLDLLA